MLSSFVVVVVVVVVVAFVSCVQCFRVSRPPAVRPILFYDRWIWDI